MVFSLTGATETQESLITISEPYIESAVNGFYRAGEIIFYVNPDLQKV